MAGDWIKWSKGLPEKPEVVRLAGLIGVPREVVVCRLMKFWEWCDDNIASDSISESGSAFVTLSPSAGDNAAFVDALVGTPKFSDSLALVGWIKFRDGRVELPNFGRHNGETAKTRARNALNQKRKRGSAGRVADPPPEELVTEVSPQMSPRRGDKTVTRGQERREEEHSASQSGGSTDPPRPRARSPAKEKPAEPKPRKQADTPHQRAIDGFCSSWQAKYGEPFPFGLAREKHGAAVKAMLAEVGGSDARFVEVVGRYLADPDPYLVEKRHPIGLLQSGFAKWLVAAPAGTKPTLAPSRPPSYFDPATCSTI